MVQTPKNHLCMNDNNLYLYRSCLGMSCYPRDASVPLFWVARVNPRLNAPASVPWKMAQDEAASGCRPRERAAAPRCKTRSSRSTWFPLGDHTLEPGEGLGCLGPCWPQTRCCRSFWTGSSPQQLWRWPAFTPKIIRFNIYAHTYVWTNNQ